MMKTPQPAFAVVRQPLPHRSPALACGSRSWHAAHALAMPLPTHMHTHTAQPARTHRLAVAVDAINVARAARLAVAARLAAHAAVVGVALHEAGVALTLTRLGPVGAASVIIGALAGVAVQLLHGGTKAGVRKHMWHVAHS